MYLFYYRRKDRQFMRHQRSNLIRKSLSFNYMRPDRPGMYIGIKL